jgi:putative redox protein
MSNSVQVTVNQIGPSASEGTVREHTAFMDRPEAKGGENRGAMGGSTC